MRANESPAEHTSEAARALPPGITARKRDTGRAADTAGHGDPASPHTIRALQRSAGNAAVTRIVQRRREEERHTHGAGCGHEQPAPVQRRSIVDKVLSSPGRPLPEPVREDMESRLGADFSDVVLHTDSLAKESTVELDATAWTSGNHIAMNTPRIDPHTLAHELGHVKQQRQGPVAGTDMGDGTKVSDPSDAFEREAEANARRVMSGPAPSSWQDGQE
ncbi:MULTISPECIES: DUF4157 domain-containing protein [unclassified Streptomyces]|uniref:eCIS core domain-containing protein n=1 Tax=unclassified Streptomyces TaxID=2593676 RepID=UPI0004BE4D86|nr:MULTISPECIES: DUF4157 domain-containing protein [unclassified Streptomyces]